MAKYYVVCGDLFKVVDADNPKNACRKAINMATGETISNFMFYVDERGFRFPLTKEDGTVNIDTETLPFHFIPVKEILPDLNEI